MRGFIMQNIFSIIQRHDVLAPPVSLSCTMSSFNDFDCMKTVADMKSYSDKNSMGVIDIFSSPHFCLL